MENTHGEWNWIKTETETETTASTSATGLEEFASEDDKLARALQLSMQSVQGTASEIETDAVTSKNANTETETAVPMEKNPDTEFQNTLAATLALSTKETGTLGAISDNEDASDALGSDDFLYSSESESSNSDTEIDIEKAADVGVESQIKQAGSEIDDKTDSQSSAARALSLETPSDKKQADAIALPMSRQIPIQSHKQRDDSDTASLTSSSSASTTSSSSSDRKRPGINTGTRMLRGARHNVKPAKFIEPALPPDMPLELDMQLDVPEASPN